jgi:hypothetical protein
VLTTIPRLPGRLLLTGARPSGLLARLAELATDSELDVDVSRAPAHQYGAGPATAFVDGDPADAEVLCERAGITFAPTACAQIAAVLPQVRLDTSTVAHTPDERFPHARLDPHSFLPRWDLPADRRDPGLWLYRYPGPVHLVLVTEDGPRLVLDRDYGPYLMDRPPDADPVIEYQPAHSLLVVNAAAPLPRLHARAAALCSGRVPVRHHLAPGIAFDNYLNVDSSTATQILSTLGTG